MAQTIKHVKVSGVPDGSDTAQVQPSDWNADHQITGTVAYSEISGKPTTFPPTLPILESDVTNLVSDLALKAPLASPTFTGDPKAPTPATADNDTSIATTAHVHAAIAADVVRASTTEVLTGIDTAKVVTPDALAALWERGDIAAATDPLILPEGGLIVVGTGVATINDIDFATPKDGRGAWVRFNGTPLTLVHSATLLLPGAANIVTAFGDSAYFTQLNGDNILCTAFIKANGKATIGPAAADITDSTVTGRSIMTAASAAAAATAAGVGTGDSPTHVALTLSNGQISFPAAQNASAGVNVLDDYEEGTFTPGITFGGAAVGMTFSAQAGNYVKIGKAVTFTVYVVLSAKGSSVGTALVTGLPFTSINSYAGCGSKFGAMTSGVGDTTLTAVVNNVATTIVLAKMASGGQVVLADTDFTATSSIIIGGTYYV